MSYIIDADWIIQMTRGNQRTISLVERLGSSSISVSWLTMGEIYEIAFNTPNPGAILDFLHRYTSSFNTIGLNSDIAMRFAEIRGDLRRRGLPIDDVDVVVAATALSRDLTVLTYNRRHFERIPDLRVYRVEG